MEHQFERTELLLGQEGMERLARARVAVFGVGGVGGHAVEALARSGIGALDLFLMQKFKLGVPWIIGISAALGLLFFGVLGL